VSSSTVLGTPYGGCLTVLRKQGARNVTDLMDSRFRGNDKLGYVLSIEELPVSDDLKTVSLNSLLKTVTLL